MTTVAWDGKTVAADSLIHGSRYYHGTKLWKLRNGLIFGGSGERQSVMVVKAFLELLDADRFQGQFDFSNLPAKPAILEGFSGLIIANKKAYRIENLIEPWEVPAPFAIGSGCDFAVSAMVMGKTAAQAVLFASQFDLNTGGSITSMEAE